MKVYNDSCLNILDKIPDGSVDLILTDIPYNISQDNNFKTMKDRTGRNGIDFGEWDKNFNELDLKYLIPKLSSDGSLVSFMAFEQYSIVKKVLEEDMVVKDRIIYEKTNPMPRNRDRRYVNNIELGVWFVRKKAKWTFNRQSEKYDSCVMKYPSESGGGFKRYHPCQKNEKMIEELVLRHSNKGDTVWDPYMGAGTTGIACKNLDRNFIGTEIDKKYFEAALSRMK